MAGFNCFYIFRWNNTGNSAVMVQLWILGIEKCKIYLTKCFSENTLNVTKANMTEVIAVEMFSERWYVR